MNRVYDYLTKTEKMIITKETLTRYIDILIKAKIIYRCDRFDQKRKRTLRGECKFYLADMALYFAMNTDNRISFSASLENLVYLYLTSNHYQTSVGRIGKLECDFITRDRDGSYAYIQGSQTVSSPETEEREYRPFTLIRDGYPRYLITTDQFRNQRDGVRHLSAVDVFMGIETI